MLRIGSLCSGAGGLDLAVEHVTGGRTIWHAEYDDDAAKVLETRWPGVPNHRDITATDWTSVEPIDILTAGYPCQPFSAAGQRKGTDDERHLWPCVAQAIRVLRPRLVVLENVAGHRSLGFDSVLADLAEMRYVGSWCSLRASDVGAPHRRERLFIVAHPEGHGWNQGRPESAGFLGRPDVAIGGVPSSADTKGDGREGLNDGTRSAQACGGRERQPSGSTWGTSGSVDLLPTPAASDGARGPDYARVDREASGGDDLITTVFRAMNDSQWGKYRPAIRRWESITREAPAPTELGPKGGPRLAAPFSEWMQGWPLGWVTSVPISRSAMLRIIGNGVVPQQAIAALYWLLGVSELAA